MDFRIVCTILKVERVPKGVAEMGAVIMLGALFGLIGLIFGLVLRYDPQANRSQAHDQ